MKYSVIILNLTILFSMTGLELATNMENRKKPIDTMSNSSMEITKKSGKIRNLKLINKSKDNSSKQMLWFLEPKDDYGIGFLKIEKKGQSDFMSMWLPGFKKNRRIQSQNKSDSFMGSDLSYEDMTNRDLDEYNFKILSEEAFCTENSKQTCYILSSIPKDEYSEYSEHKTWVSKDNYLAIKEESYDKNKNKLKYKEIKYTLIDDYYIMNYLNVKNVQKNTSTILKIENIKINNGFTDNLFHQKNLKRVPVE